MIKKFFLTAVVAVALSVGVHAADQKGFLGFKPDAQTSGSPADPTITSVTVKSVEPNSPAAAQHLTVGDEILEADGHTVPGGRGMELRPILQKKVGETLHLKLKRASGETYSADLKAVKGPH